MATEDQTRRNFIIKSAAIAAIGAATATVPSVASPSQETTAPTSPVHPPSDAISASTLQHAEKLAGITFTSDERKQMLNTIDEQRSVLAARLARGTIPNHIPPATIFNAQLSGTTVDRATPSGDPWNNLPNARSCPTDDLDLAFAPVWQLGQWLRKREVTSKHLTQLSLSRLKQFNPRLNCVITLTEDIAMKQAELADRELDAGQWRGPLHGVPWGAKDIMDTAGIGTTWGAAAYKDRVPDEDAFVVKQLQRAGAVLVAKLAVGALAYGDIWFGGTCKNPFDPEEGSSGSSAGSASATAAGLIPFTLGTETYGSIVSPCMRCGATGLRPTFGRVARNGVMALCWTLDKIGPICRTVLDTALVLRAINGSDPLDPSSIDRSFTFDPADSVRGLRLGYHPASLTEKHDLAALHAARTCGATIVEVEKLDIDNTPLLIPLFVEAAAAFEELTRSNQDDLLSWQDDEAWPNSFRQSWLIPAVELVQASRVRRQIMEEMHTWMNDKVDAIICPAFDDLLLITNATGHPSLVMRTAIQENGKPIGTTLIGRLFDEGTLCRLGMAIEAILGVAYTRPPLTT